MNVRFGSPRAVVLLEDVWRRQRVWSAIAAVGTIFFMFAAVFSCTTMSTVAGNSTLPLTWSPCVCVLMIVVTGLLRQLLDLVENRLPPARVLGVHDGDAVGLTKTAVLPPPPFSTNRLSFSFSTSTTFGAAGCRLLIRGDRHRQGARRDQYAEHSMRLRFMPSLQERTPVE